MRMNWKFHLKGCRVERRSSVQWVVFLYLPVRSERYQEYCSLKCSQDSASRGFFHTVKQPECRLSTDVICPSGEKFWGLFKNDIVSP